MLTITGLDVGYGDGGRVLEGVALSLEAGECVALMGRNGMGKTTLLKTLMGHLRASRGSIRFRDRETIGLPAFAISNLGIAHVPQGREIFPDLSVEENLKLGMLGKGLGSIVPEQIYQWFPILESRKRQRAGTMSGGEQQQLAVARALAGRPRLLMLDEPSEGIQPSIVQSMVATLTGIVRAEGIALLLVEQSVDMVRALTRRCMFMENGRIVAHTPSEQLSAGHEQIVRYLSV